MSDNPNRQSSQSAWPNQTVAQLTILAGKWKTEVQLPGDQAPIRGEMTYEWTAEGYFLIQRSGVAQKEFPQAYAIIGSDDSLNSYTMIYFDSRGVSRIYQMSLTADTWKLWRDAPGFLQRFVGTFGDNGNTIAAYWEKSTDGVTWELDFNIVYTRAN